MAFQSNGVGLKVSNVNPQQPATINIPPQLQFSARTLEISQKFVELNNLIDQSDDDSKTVALFSITDGVLPRVLPGNAMAPVTKLFVQMNKEEYATEEERSTAMRHVNQHYSNYFLNSNLLSSSSTTEDKKELPISQKLLEGIKKENKILFDELAVFTRQLDKANTDITLMSSLMDNMKPDVIYGLINSYSNEHTQFEDEAKEHLNSIKTREENIKKSEADVSKTINEFLETNEKRRGQVNGIFTKLAVPMLSCHETASHGYEYWMGHSQDFSYQSPIASCNIKVTVDGENFQDFLNDYNSFNVEIKAFIRKLKEFEADVLIARQHLDSHDVKFEKMRNKVLGSKETNTLGFKDRNEKLLKEWKGLNEKLAEHSGNVEGILNFFSVQHKEMLGELNLEKDKVLAQIKTHLQAAKGYDEQFNTTATKEWKEFAPESV